MLCEVKGCLAWVGAFALVGALSVMVVVGLVMNVLTDASALNLTGSGLVAGAGVLTIVAGRSGRFARSIILAADPVAGGLGMAADALAGQDASSSVGDDPFHARTGRHALPVGIGIGLLLLAGIMAAFALLG